MKRVLDKFLIVQFNRIHLADDGNIILPRDLDF